MLDFASAPAMFDSSDLSDYGDMSGDVVESAVDMLRRACGWHIAPTWEQTVRIDVDPQVCRSPFTLFLPTLHLISVDAVQDTAAASAITDYTWSHRGYLERVTPWPTGLGAVSVTFTHGLPVVPRDLAPVVAELARDAQVAAAAGTSGGALEQMGPFRFASGRGAAFAEYGGSVPAKYRILPRM